MTTDRAPKACTVRAGGVTVSAQAKGAGMIEPGFATMLCFVQTDAAVDDPEAELRRAVAASFERITVDGQMSTNDTVLLQATGAAGGRCPTACSTPSCCSSRSRSSPTARARPGSGGSRSARPPTRRGRAGRARDRQLAAGEDGALRARPELGPDRAGGRDGARGRGARRARRRRRSTPPSSAARRRRPRSRSGSAAATASAHIYFSDLTTSTSGSTQSTRHEHADWPLGHVGSRVLGVPYIREFHGRTVVIKYGGAAMRDEALRDDFATDVVLLKYVGLNPVIVHGGGPDITRYMERLGMEVRFVEGMRVSDPETVEVAKMVLLGKVNADIVMRLNRHGQPAGRLSGEDGALFEIAPHERAEEVGFVGEIERVDVDVLNHIAADYIPVIASAGVDREGTLLQRQRRHRRRQGRRRRLAPTRRSSSPTSRAGSPTPRTSRLAELARHRRRGRGRARLGRRRHAPEARRLRRGDRRRRRLRAHRRRPPPALAAARAVHGCRHRHDGHAVSVRRSAGARAPLRDADLRAGAGRVRARLRGRGSGTPRGASTSTSSPASRSTTPATATRGSSPRSPSRRRASPDLEPLLLRARDAALRAALRVEPRRPRLPLQLRRRGERVRDQAGPQARPRARDRRARDRQPRGRLPRPHARRRSPRRRSSPRRPLRAAAARLRRGRRATIRRALRARSASAPPR